jgi:hypothetical protein
MVGHPEVIQIAAWDWYLQVGMQKVNLRAWHRSWTRFVKIPTAVARVPTLLYPEYTLRRILAALLVLFFGAGPLLPALALSRVQSDVPTCCRKDGAHRCSVRSAEKSNAGQNGKPGLRAVCPFLSHAVPGIAGPQSFVSPSAAELFAAVVPIQALFSYRVATVLAISFLGNPKRGPPQLPL